MLSKQDQYNLAFRIAAVAGIFAVVVCVLLLMDYSGRVADDPLNSPEFLTLRDELQDRRGDESLLAQIREMDFQLRQQYFNQRRFAQWGTWMLLSGTILMLVSAKFAATLHRPMPHPEARSSREDLDGQIQTAGRWAVIALAGVLVLTVIGLRVSVSSVLPPDHDALLALLESHEDSDDGGDSGTETAQGTGSSDPDGSETPDGAEGSTDPDAPTTEPPGTAEVILTAEGPLLRATVGLPALPDGPPAAEEIARYWPRFRGPDGSGVSATDDIPTQWNVESGEGIRWKTEVPLPGNGSAIVWADRVFLSGADEEHREVYCFDADSGDLRWQTEIPATPETPDEAPEVGETTGFAAPTPATDGKLVYAMYANGDLAAVDYQGNVRWVRSFGLPNNVYGHAASLAMHGELLIVQFDQGARDDELSKLYAIQGRTGAIVWQVERAVPNSWPTPIVIVHEGQSQIITCADPYVIAYAADDGHELWRAKCLQADVGPSPVYRDGVVYVANEFPGIVAIRAGGSGDVTDTHVIWESDIGAPDCCSPLVSDKYLLTMPSYCTLTCFDRAEGVDPLWEEDFDASAFSASPGMAGGNVYLFDDQGAAWIVKPSDEGCERILETNMGEGCVASPAFQPGRIYIRGEKHLFCIGDKASAGTDAPADDVPTDDEIAKQWPRFRGPDGSGVSAYDNVPTQWDVESGEGIRWKTQVPLAGNSSPIVWDQRVFLSGADEGQRQVFCFDTESGELLWQTDVSATPETPAEAPEVGETTGFAAPTPVTNGRQVAAMFANGDIVGVDFEGSVLWTRSLGLPNNIYGHAASLASYKNMVIVQFDQGARDDELSKLLALDAASGETIWETPRAVPNSWPSPIVIRHEGQAQVITCADPFAISYSADDGQEIWRAKCLQADVGPSPVYHDGVLYVANEFPGIAAIRLGGTGDVTDTHVIWEGDIGAPDCCSPLVTDEFLLTMPSYCTLTCFDKETGVDPLWEEDFDASMFSASPGFAGKYVYLFDDEGNAWVVEPTKEGCNRVLETNMGEGCVASPAFLDGRIYVRGQQHLFCIGAK